MCFSEDKGIKAAAERLYWQSHGFYLKYKDVESQAQEEQIPLVKINWIFIYDLTSAQIMSLRVWFSLKLTGFNNDMTV